MPNTSLLAPLPNRKVCTLAFDGMPLFEFSISVELFGLDRPEMGSDWYRFKVVGFDDGPCRTTAGVQVAAPYPLEDLEDAGTIIIPGWPIARPVPEKLRDVIVRAYGRGARILTI